MYKPIASTSPELPATIGGRIRYRRLMLGIEQQWAAAQINMAGSYLNKIENGIKPFPIRRLKQLADVLNTTADFLIGLRDEPERETYLSIQLHSAEAQTIAKLVDQMPQGARQESLLLVEVVESAERERNRAALERLSRIIIRLGGHRMWRVVERELLAAVEPPSDNGVNGDPALLLQQQSSGNGF